MSYYLTIAERRTSTARCRLSVSVFLLALAWRAAADGFPEQIFGYQQLAHLPNQQFSAWRLMQGSQRRSCISNHRHCDVPELKRFLARTIDLPPLEQLRSVNQFVNRAPYFLDRENYQRDDYWAAPQELLLNGGDCEDFALTKMQLLLALGLPAERMRMVVVQDTVRRRAHAILAVAEHNQVWVLDNLSARLHRDTELPHYAPVYSINAQRWWTHHSDAVDDRHFVQID